MNQPNVFQQIILAVKQEKFYVPREYKTIGGMWTVDTWKRGDVTVQVMDEGYTTRIIAPGLQVIDSYPNQITFQTGNESILNAIWEGMQ